MKIADFSRIIKVVSLLGLLFSCVFIPPLLLSVFYDDGDQLVFSSMFVASVVLTSLVWFLLRRNQGALHKKDAFLIAVLFWMVSSMIAAMPFHLVLQVSLTDALFEAVSGMTTTGATVLSGLDAMPRSLLFYRQELQWFGGMGLLVLAIAVIPQLGVGGMSIYKAEAPGPLKDEKLTPKVRHTAAIFWKLYLGVTVLCALAYWLVGMPVFDAVAHSLSTVSTGGFSTHDASLNYFNSIAIENVAVFFMLVGAINFSIHFIALKNQSLRYYWQNDEVRVFILVIAVSVLLIMLSLDYEHFYHAGDALKMPGLLSFL